MIPPRHRSSIAAPSYVHARSRLFIAFVLRCLLTLYVHPILRITFLLPEWRAPPLRIYKLQAASTTAPADNDKHLNNNVSRPYPTKSGA